ncbi:MAG: UDP-N-acetylmuramate:L-alanyl-gamma-D-glutamyl-meso-diaminopimelate ligase [Deltaproteobacteria bacterium]|nr:MAG: UDP-N-acetylmuramate:L-alanyl-gamma-D-glutamyl-meso-diaminopimelate ligase [Deltaproteobacteria bacterium]
MLPENNRIPQTVRHIHLIAVCGTAMGALACMLKDLGYTVTGSDNNVYPPMNRFLEEKGIVPAGGFDAGNLADRPDLVVVGNAVSRDNAEVVAVAEMGLCYCSMPQAVNRFAAADKRQVLVTGTHGKTTTSALIAWILQHAGRDPSFIIGGILSNFSSNYRSGAGDCIVIEADEYDTAFFDKRPKFLHYTPQAAVLTSVEFDHADIYRDLDHVRDAFSRFIRQMPGDSLLLHVDDDPNVAGLVNAVPCQRETYGTLADSCWRFDNVALQPSVTQFDVNRRGDAFGRFTSRLIGSHNLKNTLAAIAVADYLGISADHITSALETFRGVRRRQEIRGQVNGVIVMDDFAHHPSAVRETVAAVKAHFPSRRVVAVFEPRTNSSMRQVFQNDYAGAFDAADRICIRHPPMLHKVPEGERFSSRKLVDDLNRCGKQASYFEDTDAILEDLAQTSRAGDVVLVMSNGGFDNIHERLLELL